MAISAAELQQLMAGLGTRRGGNAPTPDEIAALSQFGQGTARTPGVGSIAGLNTDLVHRRETPFNAAGTIDPTLNFTHPSYTGSDAAYQEWLAAADLQANNEISQAKLRRAQLQDAYKQALGDLDRQSVLGRRNIQTGMLQRGMFRSGETDRRQQEYDAQIAQAQARAGSALQDQIGQVDASQQNLMSSLSMQGASQVSQAMMRDALAAYQAQQDAAAGAAAAPAPAPQPSYAPPPAATAPTYNPKPPPQPTYNPVTSSAGLYQAQSKPKPKPAAGSTGHLVQASRPGQLQ